jgi:hypothetical protein
MPATENVAAPAEAPAPRVPSPMEALLQELAESEHHLRHPEAFAELCAAAGFRVVKQPRRYEVEPDA